MQPGFAVPRADSAFLYASRTVAGIPDSGVPVPGLAPGDGLGEVPGLFGEFRGGRSVWYGEPPSIGGPGGGVASAAGSVRCTANPGAWEAVIAAIAAAATAVVAAPLRSRRPNFAAIRLSPPWAMRRSPACQRR